MSWSPTSPTIEAKNLEEGLGVQPHLQQNPVLKLSQHKVLESTSLVAVDKNHRHNIEPNGSVGFN